MAAGTMQRDERRWRWPSRRAFATATASRAGAALAAGTTACLALAACFLSGPPVYPPRDGLVGGRVLMAPGTGLAGARVVIDQVNLYDGKAELRKHVGETVTDEHGYFEALPTLTINGLISIDVSGGTYTDPINGARIQLDSSVHLKAIHWLGLFEDRSETMYVTPVHALIEARFRHKMPVLKDTIKAVDDAYAHLDAHFGGLDWDTVIPADLGVASPSPTDEVRAAFVLGGLAVLTEDLRTASNATPQVVNLMTVLDAATRDLGDAWLDGNDANLGAPGSGLQVGDCPPVADTCAVPSGCPLGACRPLCDVYANTYRSLLADSIAKFIGPKASPRTWNLTTLGSEDARAFLDGIARNPDPDLFGDACAETQHRVPPTVLWDAALPDGALRGSSITLQVRAVDNDGNKLPTVSLQGYPDTDGDPTNDVATATVDTRAATGGVDGPLTVTAIATGAAGATSTSTRTFQIDNTPPVITLDSGGLLVDDASVWWSATPGPILHGTVSDAHLGTVQVTIGGAVVATATVDGTGWSASLPDTALPGGGADVAIIATDRVGNVATKVQTLRLDTTAPTITVDASPVNDEILSKFTFEDSASGSFAAHRPEGAPVDLSTTGTCPTLHKHAHLLFAPRPDGTHAVLGSSGALNPIALNILVSDDGVGVQPGSAQYRVLFRNGAALDELLPWTAMPPPAVAPSGTRRIPLHRDAIPPLGTTNGEYHIELRATDPFGRTATQARCWNHLLLAPPLSPTSGSGEKAQGFQRALFSTKLHPGPGETGDFAAKFLNASPAGAAVWRTRFKNYLGLPVHVTVQISGGASATVSREFRIQKSLTAITGVSPPRRCGTGHCISDPPPGSTTEYASNFNAPTTHQGIKYQARLFEMVGNETGPELGTCGAGCADDATQTYKFVIPARTAGQGPLPEYAFLTYLRPTLPAGAGTNVTMAPSDASQPDSDPAPYGEFDFNGTRLTGKLVGTPSGNVCIEEDRDDVGFVCITEARFQRYRALARIQYRLFEELVTAYAFAPTATLPSLTGTLPGTLNVTSAIFSTDETNLP